MDQLSRLDRFELGKHGDRHEREFWPFLSTRFPSYEVLWRRLIVPLTRRVELEATDDPQSWIRLRDGIPERYERVSMAHYSVFYFLGRAVKRFRGEPAALEYPEDVLFLLDSVWDNLELFVGTMNDLGADCGRKVFDVSAQQLKETGPFREISGYRNVFLHNTVIGRAVDVKKTLVPKWNLDRAKSPLEEAKKSWRAAERLPAGNLVSTDVLLERLIEETCSAIEEIWKKAIEAVATEQFTQKMMKIIGLANIPDVPAAALLRGIPAASAIWALGSNTTFPAPPSAPLIRAPRPADRTG